MGYDLGTGVRTEGGHSDGNAYGEDSWGLDVCSPGGLSNWNISGNIGENPLGRVLVQIVKLRESPPEGYQMGEVDYLMEEWEHMLGLCFVYVL